MRSGLDKLAPSDRDFAQSLLASASGRGLSEKQTAWAHRLARKLTSKPVVIGEMAGLIALLDRAQTNLKRPRLLSRAGSVDIRITIAGPASRTPGALMVTDAKAGDIGRAFYGRISRDGVFEAGKDLDPDLEPFLLNALRSIATDPQGAAMRFGRVTGACCFCALPLQNAASVSAGYGPICAEKWGLPWGEVREYHTHA